MNDTPRTDAVRAKWIETSQDEDVIFDYARELERALRELVAECQPKADQLALLGVKAPTRAALNRAKSALRETSKTYRQ